MKNIKLFESDEYLNNKLLMECNDIISKLFKYTLKESNWVKEFTGENYNMKFDFQIIFEEVIIYFKCNKNQKLHLISSLLYRKSEIEWESGRGESNSKIFWDKIGNNKKNIKIENCIMDAYITIKNPYYYDPRSMNEMTLINTSGENNINEFDRWFSNGGKRIEFYRNIVNKCESMMLNKLKLMSMSILYYNQNFEVNYSFREFNSLSTNVIQHINKN